MTSIATADLLALGVFAWALLTALAVVCGVGCLVRRFFERVGR